MKAYLDWCKSNGVIMDKVDFPAVFSGVCGAKANSDIEPNEAFVYVPNKLIVSVEAARKSELSDVFRSHDALFVSNIDRDYFILVVFVLFERTKGDKSFWHPYFEAVNPGSYTSLWPDNVIAMIDEPELKLNLKTNRDKIELDYENVQKLKDLYPQHFGLVTRDMFEWAIVFVTTRCFGWGLPSTMLVPLADALNH